MSSTVSKSISQALRLLCFTGEYQYKQTRTCSAMRSLTLLLVPLEGYCSWPRRKIWYWRTSSTLYWTNVTRCWKALVSLCVGKQFQAHWFSFTLQIYEKGCTAHLQAHSPRQASNDVFRHHVRWHPRCLQEVYAQRNFFSFIYLYVFFVSFRFLCYNVVLCPPNRIVYIRRPKHAILWLVLAVIFAPPSGSRTTKHQALSAEMFDGAEREYDGHLLASNATNSITFPLSKHKLEQHSTTRSPNKHPYLPFLHSKHIPAFSASHNLHKHRHDNPLPHFFLPSKSFSKIPLLFCSRSRSISTKGPSLPYTDCNSTTWGSTKTRRTGNWSIC